MQLLNPSLSTSKLHITSNVTWKSHPDATKGTRSYSHKSQNITIKVDTATLDLNYKSSEVKDDLHSGATETLPVAVVGKQLWMAAKVGLIEGTTRFNLALKSNGAVYKLLPETQKLSGDNQYTTAAIPKIVNTVSKGSGDIVSGTQWSGTIVNDFDDKEDNDNVTLITQLYVTNAEQNVAGKQVELSATFNDTFGDLLVKKHKFLLVEPFLNLSMSVDPLLVSGNVPVTFTLDMVHLPTSTSAAFNSKITILLAKELDPDFNAFKSHVEQKGGVANFDTKKHVVTVTVAQFNLKQKLSFVLKCKAKAAIKLGCRPMTAALLEWYSTPNTKLARKYSTGKGMFDSALQETATPVFKLLFQANSLNETKHVPAKLRAKGACDCRPTSKLPVQMSLLMSVLMYLVVGTTCTAHMLLRPRIYTVSH